MKKFLTLSVLLVLVAGFTTGCVFQSELSQSDVPTKSWKTFDSSEDSGLKQKVSFNYPEIWNANDAMGGDGFSEVLFVDAEKESVAYMGFFEEKLLKKGSQPKIGNAEDIEVDGIISQKVIESDSQGQRVVLVVPYDKELELIFIFQMPVINEESIEIFDEIVKTIKF